MLDLFALREFAPGSRILGIDSYECITNDLLVLDGLTSRVLWLSAGGDRVIRQFTCECRPLDAVFCRFPDQVDSDCNEVCVAILLTPSYMRVHQSSGEHSDLRLNTPCSRLFAIPAGVLLLALPFSDSDDMATLNMSMNQSPVQSPGLRSPHLGIESPRNTSPSECSIMIGMSRQARSTLFTLTHPTAVPLPLAIRSSSNSFSKADNRAMKNRAMTEDFKSSPYRSAIKSQFENVRGLDGLFVREREIVVAVCGPLVVTKQFASEGTTQFGTQIYTLRLWTLQRVAKDEMHTVLASLRSTGASVSSRMSLGSRGSRGSGGASTHEGEIGPLAHARAKSPSLGSMRASPVTTSNSYRWEHPEGRSSPVVGLESALGISDHSDRRYVDREGGDAGNPLAMPFNNVAARDSDLGRDHALHAILPNMQWTDDGRSGVPQFCLELLDSASLHISDTSIDDIKFSLSGHRTGMHDNALVLVALHARSGVSNHFIVRYSEENGTFSGELVPMQPLDLPSGHVPRSIAHICAPLFPGRGPVRPTACVTFVIHSKATTAEPCGAALFIGSSRVGSISLQCKDDMHCLKSLELLTALSSTASGALVGQVSGKTVLIGISPALLLSDNVGVAEMAALAALRAVSGGDVVAELSLGLFMIASQAQQANEVSLSGAILLLRAAFGLPAPANLLPNSSTSYSELTEIYSRLVPLLNMLDVRIPLFDALHAAWQDLRLQGSRMAGTALRSLGEGLAMCAAAAGGPLGQLYCTYYGTYVNISTKIQSVKDFEFSFTAYQEPPCAARWIGKCLEVIGEHFKSTSEQDIPAFQTPAQGCLCIDLCRTFFRNVLHGLKRHGSVKYANWARLLAEAYVGNNTSDCGLTGCDPNLYLITFLPPLIRQIVELSLYECRDDPNKLWNDVVLRKIGRYDLCKVGKGLARNITESAENAPQPAVQPTGALPIGGTRRASVSDGLREVEAAAALRFAEDDRIHEACRLLRSSDSIYLRVDKAPETTDLDHRHRIQMRLLTLCRRSLACSVGRGALTMGSLQPLMAEALPVPPLNLSGRVPPSNGIVHLDTATAPPELTLWPEFHNGVAAGLRVGRNSKRFSPLHSPRGGVISKDEGNGRTQVSSGLRVTRNWILYNRTAAIAAAAAAARANVAGAMENAISSHAGVLLALGLQGHLNVLSKSDICDYLSQGNEPTTVAMLLGMAASKVGTADARLSKTLCLYLPTLLPQRHQDIDISPLVQTAALAGLGLLHVGSGHRLMTEFLLAEMSRRPTSDRCDTREGLALTAGWALGLVLLGKGAERTGLGGLVDLHIEDRLVQHFMGGHKPPESYLFPTVVSSNDGAGKASRVLEGSDINTDVTGPGALLALALIYLRSNDAEIGKRMALPQTVFEIDSLRPDMLLYRTTCLCLVLWDSVTPSESWIDAQVPAVVRRVLFKEQSKTPYALHGNSAPKSGEPLSQSDSIPQLFGRGPVELQPKVALAAYICIITGYGFGMSLVFAGSGDHQAKNAIFAQLCVLQSLRDNKSARGLPVILVDKSMRPLIDMCVCVLAVSLATVMAGTGDVNCLRIFRELRWKVDDVVYGTHLALGHAIGLLFLGGGTCSVRRDPLSIACLLIALCPRYPSRSIDNQYHLQALRHLYAMSVESRVLRTVDVDTGRAVSVDVRVELKSGEILQACAPCLLPELETVLAVQVNPLDSIGVSEQEHHYADLSTTSAASKTSMNSSIASGDVVSNRSLFFGMQSSSQGKGQAAQRAADLFPTSLQIAASVTADKELEIPALFVKRRIPRAPSNSEKSLENTPSARVATALGSLLDPFESGADSQVVVEPRSLETSQGNELTMELLMTMLNICDDEMDNIISSSIFTCAPLVQLLNGALGRSSA